MSAVPDSTAMLAALRNPAAYPHPVVRVELIETHISWVLLTGTYAYKIKKPVNLGFLDFTTLAARRHFCEEELRLNRRLAPELYLDVVPIAGAPGAPRIGGDGPPLEYAVKMRQFDQACLLDNAVRNGEIATQAVASLARKLADFHAHAQQQVSAQDQAAGVLKPATDNFAQLLALVEAPAEAAALNAIRAWTLRTFEALAATFTQRATRGFVRECHGDLHLGNIVLLKGAAVPFDCLEFNPELRRSDVLSEVAFLMMDLEAHNRRDLAYAFLSAYLEASGDYAGAPVLRFYLVYRAMVRAKVSLLRSRQPGLSSGERASAVAAYRNYVDVALAQTHAGRGAIVITHGYSGSGKSTFARRLTAALGAVCIRSDVVRKRLHGVDELERTHSAANAGIYAQTATERTYRALLAQTADIAAAGLPVIVDAAFLKIVYRAAFHTLAAALAVPFVIADVRAALAQSRARISARAATGMDASDATLPVLDAQLRDAEPLTSAEASSTVVVYDGAAGGDSVLREISHRLETAP